MTNETRRVDTEAGTTRYRWLTLLWTLIVPVLALAGSLVWVATILPELPDPVAIHFGVDGPDGFGSVWTTLIMLPIVILGFSIVAAIATRSGAVTANAFLGRFWSAVVVFFTAVMIAAIAGSLQPQRGLADARDTDGGAVGQIMLLGALIGLVLAVIAYLSVPKGSDASVAATSPATLHLQPSEHAVWRSRARSAAWLRVGIPAVVLLTLIVTLLTTPTPWWVVVLMLLILGVLLSTLLDWTVVVDHTGLRVVSFGGVFRFRVPLAAVVRADTGALNGLGEFGGYGIRVVPGRFGVITRSGEALLVTRSDRPTQFVVTVDDANTGAALLNGLRERLDTASPEA